MAKYPERSVEESIKVYEKALKTLDPTTDKVWVDRYTSLINSLKILKRKGI